MSSIFDRPQGVFRAEEFVIEPDGPRHVHEKCGGKLAYQGNNTFYDPWCNITVKLERKA